LHRKPDNLLTKAFGVQRSAIRKHLANILKKTKFDGEVVCSILELPTPHGAIENKTQILIKVL
jgi:hypothetical protein